MTLETCKSRLELYKKRGNQEQIDFWEQKVQHKLNLPKYAHLRPKEELVKPEVKDGKKPKR